MRKTEKKNFNTVYDEIVCKGIVDEKMGFEVATLIALDSLFGIFSLRSFKRINIKEVDFRAKWYYLSIAQYRSSLYGESKREVKSFIREMYSDYLKTDFTMKERIKKNI